MMDPPDFRIIINCHTWLVHSKHLSRSGFFQKLLSGPFLVGVYKKVTSACAKSEQESQSKSVTLHDDDPSNVVRLITWLYYGAYTTSQTRNNFGGPSVSEMLTSGQEQYKALPVTLQKSNQPSKVRPPPTYDYENNIHLAMYRLADKYDVSSSARAE